MKVLILCGGKGTRAYPFTEFLPKPMMPVAGSPVIMHLMKIFARQGFTDFVLAAGHRKEMLLDYFDGRSTDWKIQVVDTGEDSDTGERVRRCADLVGDRFMVTYGDGLGNVDLHALLAAHERAGSVATMTTVQLRSQYGLVEFDQAGLVTEFLEKPTIADRWINAGFFVFDKSIFEQWSGDNLENDILPQLARRRQLGVYRHGGFWKSMDTSKDQQELDRLVANIPVPWAELQAGKGVL